MPEVSYPTDPAQLRVVDVLLVEDDPGDVLMTREAFEASRMPSTLHVVGDGEQAMHFLRRTNDFTGAPRPSLILLDLNMPRIDGREALARIKSDPQLKNIPILIFTTSREERDIVLSKQAGASSFLSKPEGFQDLTDMLEKFCTAIQHNPNIPFQVIGS